MGVIEFVAVTYIVLGRSGSNSLQNIFTRCCSFNKTGTLIVILDWNFYTCLTQLYGGIDEYNLLHKEQLHASALFIGHLQVDK